MVFALKWEGAVDFITFVGYIAPHPFNRVVSEHKIINEDDIVKWNECLLHKGGEGTGGPNARQRLGAFDSSHFLTFNFLISHSPA